VTSADAESEASSRFELAALPDGSVEGWAAGFDRRRLRALRRGEPAPELEVDLHGLRRDEARRVLRASLREAIDADLRCVLVVHGRGAHSGSDAVLRRALPGWLAEPPHGARILAFAAAEDRRGGATCVLLRRPR
jgi:DNA-nicking Smr family endonuclease